MAAERAGVFEHHSLPGGVSLLVWNTRKFKTVSLRITLLENLDDQAGSRALTSGLLRRGCSSYPDMMSLSRRLEELYGAGLSIDVSRLGERQNLNVRLRVVNDRFVGEKSTAVRHGLDLMREILTDPVLEDGGFRKAEFEQERTNLIRSIRGLLDDKMAYAHRQLLEAMFPGEPYALFEWGTEETAKTLDARVVLAEHLLRLRQAPIEAYAVGDLDAGQVEQIGETLSGLSRREENRAVKRECWVEPVPRKLVTEELPLAQSKLLIGYRLDTRGMDDREYFALSVYNAVLGSGSSYSKLFREVREERSLAYYAHSSMDRLKGFLLLSAGVAAA
ncbi:MAG: insulinase family protein, partial [Planctomycetota bacterium]